MLVFIEKGCRTAGIYRVHNIRIYDMNRKSSSQNYFSWLTIKSFRVTFYWITSLTTRWSIYISFFISKSLKHFLKKPVILFSKPQFPIYAKLSYISSQNLSIWKLTLSLRVSSNLQNLVELFVLIFMPNRFLVIWTPSLNTSLHQNVQYWQGQFSYIQGYSKLCPPIPCKIHG